ncbi:hypothetical protein GUJ93_ZPchr0008g14036 [Zizania palustris]|uniref:Uncharacterized protein n=1 Tax=Zizania palustris TaxID=103762 RepID=A0A8J5VJZ5_ZIZPA|nr:hypothetical protein GUJ93_ZPchr0008g14036 [Zizania palustris]
MGNCQAAEAAAVVIQHPGGKVERLYWAATAADVMRVNPGHYVALVVLRVSAGGAKADHPAAADAENRSEGAPPKITKIKLLKPKETLLLGQVYRLVTSQEVTKALQARRQEKMRRCKEATDHHQPPPPPPHLRQQQPPSGDSAAATAAAAGEEQRRSIDHQVIARSFARPLPRSQNIFSWVRSNL